MSNKTKRAKKEKVEQVTAVVPATAPQTTEAAPAKSIRQTIRRGIFAGSSVADITAVLKANFPGSMAAQKPAKHIAHYRCLLKKEGQLQAAAQ